MIIDDSVVMIMSYTVMIIISVKEVMTIKVNDDENENDDGGIKEWSNNLKCIYKNAQYLPDW